MAAMPQNQEELQEMFFGKKLSAAVRNIKWSYAIFWALSSRQQGVLAWSDGYYNGDITTRRTTQPTEFKADQMALQRSEQLRELYGSLSTGDNTKQTRRPSASLSPEDLTDSEWYYMVCMSFTFNPGQGLPGKALTSDRHIWLSNAQFADSKIFSRSLLAKVLEDPALLQHVMSFWNLVNPVWSEQSISGSPMGEKDEDDISQKLVHELVNTMVIDNNNVMIDSTDDDGSNDDFLMIEGLNDTSQCHSYLLLDDESRDGLHTSLNSTDCVSRSFVNPQRVLTFTKGERVADLEIDGLQDPLDIDSDDSYFTRTLSTILMNSKKMALTSYFSDNSRESSFKVWKGGSNFPEKLPNVSQKFLKKILIEASWMHAGQPLHDFGNDGLEKKVWKSEGDDTSTSNVMSERRRIEKLNEKFLVLRSLLPSVSKDDKASILSDTIEYLKELERRVEELETSRGSAERISDNYDSNNVTNGRKTSANKRKACDIEEAETEQHWVQVKDSVIDVNLTMTKSEAFLEMRCPWRDRLIIETIEALSDLQLEARMVQSSTTDGVLTLTLRAKFSGSVAVPLRLIKEALKGVLGKC